MTTGSLVLLSLFIFWGMTVFLLLLKTAKNHGLKKGINYCILQNLKMLTSEYRQAPKTEAGLEPYNGIELMMVVSKFGYLLFFVLIIRLVLVPDLLTSGLTIISLIFWACYVFRLYKVKETYVNWQKLYELDVDYGVLEITLTSDGPGKEWIGSTLAELNLRKKELLVLAIIRKNKFTVFPKGPETLGAGDRVLVFGKYPQFGFCSVESISGVGDVIDNNHEA